MKYPIVILHGWGLSANAFASLTSELRKHDFRVYAPDFPGFDSLHIPEKPMTLSDYADFIESYLKKRGVKNPILIGHSFGGRVALKYQDLYPGHISALVLTGTPGFTPVSRKRLALFISIAKVGGTLMSLPVLYKLKDRVRLWYYYAIGARDYYRAEGVMRDTFKNIVKEPLVESMKRVRVPTILIWGEEDIIVPVRIAQKMQDVIMKSKLVMLPLSGHNVPFMNPTLFTATLLPWMRLL